VGCVTLPLFVLMLVLMLVLVLVIVLVIALVIVIAPTIDFPDTLESSPLSLDRSVGSGGSV